MIATVGLVAVAGIDAQSRTAPAHLITGALTGGSTLEKVAILMALQLSS